MTSVSNRRVVPWTDSAVGRRSAVGAETATPRMSRHDVSVFFQAEDGIRYLTVTGVQTCPLPIYRMINPQVALAPPEHRMHDAFLRLPGPGFFTPQGTVLVTPCLYKPKKFVIRYVVVEIGRASCRERV